MQIILVGGIVEKDNKFLLVQEAKKECKGKWNIPFGHLEQGENILEGAQREIYEETGCEVRLTEVLQIGNIIKGNNTLLMISFMTELVNENIKYNSEEILDVRWFTYEELQAMGNELRDYDMIMSNIESYINGINASLDIIKVL